MVSGSQLLVCSSGVRISPFAGGAKTWRGLSRAGLSRVRDRRRRAFVLPWSSADYERRPPHIASWAKLRAAQADPAETESGFRPTKATAASGCDTCTMA
jgi:hypothetical protein